MVGARGLRSLSTAKRVPTVSGVDLFCFRQFEGSPHVCYFKTNVYQGEWTGIPLITPLTPHGQGEVYYYTFILFVENHNSTSKLFPFLEIFSNHPYVCKKFNFADYGS